MRVLVTGATGVIGWAHATLKGHAFRRNGRALPIADSLAGWPSVQFFNHDSIPAMRSALAMTASDSHMPADRSSSNTALGSLIIPRR